MPKTARKKAPKQKPVIAVDFETYYVRSGAGKYSVRDLGNWMYVHDPLFDAYLMSVCTEDEVWADHPDAFNWDALKGALVVSHHAAFDRAVAYRLVEQGKAPKWVLDLEWRCTADLSVYVCGRRALKDAAEHLLGVKMDKDVRDRASGKHWSDMVAEGWSSDMLKYAHRDAIYCRQIWVKYADRWPQHERKLSDLNIRQGMDGVGVDTELLDVKIQMLQKAIFDCLARIPWVADGTGTATSTKAIALECRKQNIPCPPVKSGDEEDGHGEEAFDAWEAKFSVEFEWVRQISAWRKLNKMLKKLLLVKRRVRPDGTMGFSLKYFGAHTGRFSGDAGFNMQNLRMFPLVILTDAATGTATLATDEQSEAMLDAVNDQFKKETGQNPDKATYHDRQRIALSKGAWLVDERALLRARKPGNTLWMADLSQIEPRCLNWLAGATDFLDSVRSGYSVYEAHARATMGWTGGDLKKEAPDTQKMAKVRVLGLGYGAGHERFVEIAWVMGRLRITLEQSKVAVDDFRAQNPKIVELWREMDDALRAAAGKREDLVLELPSGRTLRYEAVRMERRVEPDRETGKPKSRSVFTCIFGGRRQITYGAKIVENITQAMARDIFVANYLALHDAGLSVLWSIHDEGVGESSPEVVDADTATAKACMSLCPEWAEGLPVGCSVEVCPHYKK